MVGGMHFGPYAMMPPHNVQATQDAQQGPQLLVINAQIAQSRLASEDTHLTGSDARAVESQEPRDSVRASVFAVDPIARLFGCAPEIIGDVSYCQYLLQWIAYDLWPLAKLPAADLMAFLAFLLLLSYVLAKGVLGWAKGLWLRQKERPALTMLLPAFTTVVLLVVGVIYSLTAPGGGRSGAPGSALPPDYVALDDEAVDLKLNWTSSTTRRADARQIINPSLLLARDGTLLCAARQHAIIRRVGEEKEWIDETGRTRIVTQEIVEWHSAILVSQTKPDVGAWDGWDASKWPLDAAGAAMQEATLTSDLRAQATWGPDLCQAPPVYVPANNTLVQTRVTGALAQTQACAKVVRAGGHPRL